jgi:hypothetical protein
VRKEKKKLNYGLAIVLGISLLIVVAPSLFTSFYSQKEYDEVTASVKGQNISQDVIDGFFTNISAARKAIVSSDAMRTFFFVLLASILIFTRVRYKFRDGYLIYGLLALVLLDLWTVDRRYIGSSDFVKKTAHENPFPMSRADEMILQDTTSYRVLNATANVFNDASVSYYHQSVGGYHGAKLKRYKELIDYRLMPEVSALKSAFGKQDSASAGVLSSQSSLNMLQHKVHHLQS